MAAVVHRIEALPGDGRYAVTFRLPDATEQTAVMQIRGAEVADVEVAESAMPVGWTSSSESFRAVARAVLAFDEARGTQTREGTLRDVEGGWDVTIGNVVQGASGRPECTAHGLMTERAQTWVCEECGARAALS